MARSGVEAASKSLVRASKPVSCGLVALALLSTIARADGVEDFYKGKSVSLIIGYSVGGGYDLYGRLVARHMGKYIPGKPTIVPQNMTGAGSFRAASFLYAAAPKDGSVFGTFGRTIATMPLLTAVSAPLDPTKLTWLGSVTNEVSLCVTWHTSPVKVWKDALDKPINMGGEGTGADPDVYALLYKNVFGAKWKLIPGYHGTNDVTLAMERGEVDGLCGLSWSTMRARHMQWYTDKKINIINQAALKKQPELPDVPLASELTQDADKLRMLKLFLATQEIARPFAAPPDIPADRKAALISAFEQTMRDGEFLAEAQKLSMDVNPLGAKAVSDLIAELYATPKPLVEQAAQAMAK
jgi:tripartite-type tricarboxylate transporter receptor subunit TctC